MSGRPQGRLAGTALALALGTTGACAAVDEGTVSRFVNLSAAFHAQLPRSGIAGLDGSQQRARAVCILTRFEGAYGRAGVEELMSLMAVLSRGTEFDDPTVVAFNRRYGGAYDQTERQCTSDARSS